jgi:hypothetical protein
MNEKYFIPKLAEKECVKMRNQAEKNVVGSSSKLYGMNDSNSSVRSRANMRAKLSTLCEDRDRWQNRIDLIDSWIEEIRRVVG